jgi:hypothetical protein
VSSAQIVWAVSFLVLLTTLPVGVMRMVIYRSGDIDHTPTHRLVAWLALTIAGVAFAVLVATTVWFVVRGERPL